MSETTLDVQIATWSIKPKWTTGKINMCTVMKFAHRPARFHVGQVRPLCRYEITFQTAVLYRYNAVNFQINFHKRQPIARPLGRGMVCVLWVHHLIDILPQFLQLFIQYLTIEMVLSCTWQNHWYGHISYWTWIFNRKGVHVQYHSQDIHNCHTASKTPTNQGIHSSVGD